MKIRNLVLLLGLVFLSFSSFSQQADSKLFEVYSNDELSQLDQNAPGSIEYLNFYVNNACYFIDFPTGKSIDHERLYKVDVKTGELLTDAISNNDLQDFNLYLYSCKPNSDKRKYYSVGDTGKMLVMRSNKEITEKFQQFKKRK